MSSLNSLIEWTDLTWNFLRGCSRESEGCVNCYAEKDNAWWLTLERGKKDAGRELKGQEWNEFPICQHN